MKFHEISLQFHSCRFKSEDSTIRLTPYEKLSCTYVHNNLAGAKDPTNGPRDLILCIKHDV